MARMNIGGKITLEHGLVLAPMAGVTDRAYRAVCGKHGAELLVSEMVSAKAIHYGDKNTRELCALDGGNVPESIQLFGHEPEIMAEAARYVASLDTPPAMIDINMGCPVKKIVSNGDGSEIMRSPELARRITEAVKLAVDIPVSVKIRAGINDSQKNAVEVARACEAGGADMIAVHGRTRAQMYAPPVDLGIIADVKRAVKIPVVGNGSIDSASDALRMLRETGCDGLMPARGTMGNPWLFEEIVAALDGHEFVPPTFEQKIAQAREHLRMLIADKGETGILEGRRHLAYYIKNCRGAAFARGRINTASSLREIEDILDDVLEAHGKEHGGGDT